MGFRGYLLKRTGNLIIVYFSFTILLFAMFRFMPGDPTTLYAIDGMTDAERQAMIERLGLDRPLHEQYFVYISDLLTGDLGTSHVYREPVIDILSVKLMNTVFLMLSGLLIAYSIGILVGAIIGWKRGTRFEKIGIVLTIGARSSPSFWVGIVLLLIFTFGLGWFPSGGMRTTGTVDVASPGLSKYLSFDFVFHLILPMLTGAIVWIATPTLLMRNSILDVLNEDFIEIKEAEGLPEYTILYKHAVRNSILPIITIAAVSAGYALGGSVVIETVFNWPGMGREMVEALFSRDYPVAQGAFFIMGSVVIFMNFVADLLYMKFDPRVGYE